MARPDNNPERQEFSQGSSSSLSKSEQLENLLVNFHLRDEIMGVRSKLRGMIDSIRTEVDASVPDAVSGAIDYSFTNEIDRLDSNLLQVTEFLDETMRDLDVAKAQWKTWAHGLIFKMVDSAIADGNLEDLFCSGIDFRGICELSACAGIRLPQLSIANSYIFTKSEFGSLEDTTLSNSFVASYSYYAGERGVVTPESRKECPEIEQVDNCIECALCTTYRNYHRSILSTLEEIVADHMEAQSLTGDLASRISNVKIGIFPIRYGEYHLGFNVLLYRESNNPRVNENALVRTYGELISRATSEAFAKMWRVNNK